MLRPGFYENEWVVEKVNKPPIKIIASPTAIYKGLETIIESQIILRTNFPNFNIIWNLVGVSNKQFLVNLFEKKYRKTLKMLDIFIMGVLPDGERRFRIKKYLLFVCLQTGD